MQNFDTAAARSLTHELLSLRNEVVDWQLSQLKAANAQSLEAMKAWTSGLELSERVARAWTQSVVDTMMPAAEKAEA